MKNIILITGGSGFIGKSFFKKISKKYKTFATYNNHKYKKKNYYKVDLSNFKKTKKLIEKIKPNIIFHFAAMANPGLNEKNKKKSRINNFLVTKNIVTLCRKKKLKMIYLSTDKVYDGNFKKNRENDKLKPRNYYGKQKLLSENYIKKNLNRFFILRLPIVHSNGKVRKDSLIDQFIYDAKKNRQVSIYNNVLRSFVKLNQLNNFLEKLIICEKKFGVYNIGSKKYSYYKRVQFLLNKYKNYKIKGVKGKVFPMIQDLNLDKSKINFSINFQ